MCMQSAVSPVPGDAMPFLPLLLVSSYCAVGVLASLLLFHRRAA